jgi:hypothetical protein
MNVAASVMLMAVTASALFLTGVLAGADTGLTRWLGAAILAVCGLGLGEVVACDLPGLWWMAACPLMLWAAAITGWKLARRRRDDGNDDDGRSGDEGDDPEPPWWPNFDHARALWERDRQLTAA